MTVVAGKSIFIDTNILIYSNNKDSLLCKSAREKLNELKDNDNQLFISDQVIREYLVIITRPGILEKPVSSEVATQDISRIEKEFCILFPSQAILNKLVELINKYKIKGKRIHDTAIVAIMLANGITDILTYNVKDFQIFSEITIHTIQE